MTFARPAAGGIEILVRLTPRGGADAVDGIATDSAGAERLAVRVRAAPEKGAANEALERLLAKVLDNPRSSVAVISGHTSRSKTVLASGDADELLERLSALTRKS
jgi:uncharacterized protein YggU (UPF0235/DUF167 family)